VLSERFKTKGRKQWRGKGTFQPKTDSNFFTPRSQTKVLKKRTSCTNKEGGGGNVSGDERYGHELTKERGMQEAARGKKIGGDRSKSVNNLDEARHLTR